MKKHLALVVMLGLGLGQTTLTLEESQNAAKFCYGAGVGIANQVVAAALVGRLADGMHPLKFDCVVEEHKGGIRVILVLDGVGIEESAAWIRAPKKDNGTHGGLREAGGN